MNFIDAHMIWHGFVDCLANKKDKQFFRQSELRNTKEDIITAFKICIAHMMFIEHVSNEEFQLTQTSSHAISLFLPDNLIDAYEQSKLVGDANDSSHALSRIINYINSTSRNNEIDSFVERLVEYFDNVYIPRMKVLLQSKERYNREYPLFFAEFVPEIYQIANLVMEENDGEYFWTIDQLKAFSENPNLTDLFPQKYAEYLNALYKKSNGVPMSIQKQKKIVIENNNAGKVKKNVQENNEAHCNHTSIRDRQKLALLIQPRIACNSYHTVFVKLDGTIITTDRRRSNAKTTLSKWTNIVAVAADHSKIYGLRSNGVLISVEADSGRRHYHDSNVVALSKQGNTIYQKAGTRYTLLGAPKKAGDNIVEVSEGSEFYAVLRNNGTVFTWKKDKYHYDIDAAIAHMNDIIPDGSTWTNIVAIDAGRDHLVGLRGDGTVVASGNNDSGQCDVSHWSDIIAIAAGDRHTVGVTTRGEVLTSGSNKQGQCNVAGWVNIVSVVAMGQNTFGVMTDGRVVGTGEYVGNGCKYDCRLFNSIDTLNEEIHKAAEQMKSNERKHALLGPSRKEIELKNLELQYAEARRQEKEVDVKRAQVRGLFKKKKLQALRDEWYKYSGIASELSSKIDQLRADINQNWED